MLPTFSIGKGEGQELKDQYEVVIIGAGPAGLSAGIYAIRSGLEAVV
ncbi:MAG: thioredoxin-disulfide reductase, partial [Thermoplasmata archaeon]